MNDSAPANYRWASIILMTVALTIVAGCVVNSITWNAPKFEATPTRKPPPTIRPTLSPEEAERREVIDALATAERQLMVRSRLLLNLYE